MAEREDVQQTQDTATAPAADQAAPRARWRKRDDHRRAGGAEHAQQAAAAPAQQPAAEGGEAEALRASIEASFQERLAAEQARAEDAVNKLTRTQADFANYKRRSEQEREQQARFATQLLVQEMLPVLDNLDRVLTTMPDAVRGLPWAEGLLLVDRHLRGTLEKQGLKAIEAVGARFDPMLHEAIIHEESPDHADDEVIAELRRGYTLHDKVVRPTLVKVAKHVGEPAHTTTGENK
jgi:molecular chaperone GrpE